ncbi:hypothetical protein PINS_up016400 [Pythium insidiosum]|nr:hypothetical protein PINS_up016400 [Pythium insidiosum]
MLRKRKEPYVQVRDRARHRDEHERNERVASANARHEREDCRQRGDRHDDHQIDRLVPSHADSRRLDLALSQRVLEQWIQCHKRQQCVQQCKQHFGALLRWRKQQWKE